MTIRHDSERGPIHEHLRPLVTQMKNCLTWLPIAYFLSAWQGCAEMLASPYQRNYLSSSVIKHPNKLSIKSLNMQDAAATNVYCHAVHCTCYPISPWRPPMSRPVHRGLRLAAVHARDRPHIKERNTFEPSWMSKEPGPWQGSCCIWSQRPDDGQ